MTGKSLRVLVTAACPFPAPRGTPIRIFHLSEAIQRRGHDVHVVTYHLGNHDNTHSFTIHRTQSASWYQRMHAGPSYGKLIIDYRLAKKVEQLLAEKTFDIIHAHHYEGLIAALWGARNCDIPIVFDAHTLLESELPSYALGIPGFIKRYAGRMLDKYLPRKSDLVIAVSDNIRDRLLSLYSIEPIQIDVVPNGVELDYFSTKTTEEADPRSPVLVFAGNLSGYQDIDVMLHAFALVRAGNKNVRLKIVTDDDFTPFDKMARELGIREDIILASGDFVDLPGHLATAAAALNPRRLCDGIPQKLLNYMASGCAIISFRGSARFLRHRESGWIAEGNDAAAFAEGIAHVLNDPALARKIGEKAHTIVAEDLSWGNAAERAEEIYLRLMHTDPSP
jgi:glycosyltransferase involved in cell wall biosynthesis